MASDPSPSTAQWQQDASMGSSPVTLGLELESGTTYVFSDTPDTTLFLDSFDANTLIINAP